MKVNIVSNNLTQLRNITKFTSKPNNWEPIEFIIPEDSFEKKSNINKKTHEYYEAKGIVRGGLTGIIITSLLGILINGCHNNYEHKKTQDLLNEVKNIVDSENIENSSILIKDVTKDDIPDITITKNDGTKITIDPANKIIIK